ncbi:MAG: hypothetical protein AB1324_04495 [Candidatus Micrarchaeota archaeon]
MQLMPDSAYRPLREAERLARELDRFGEPVDAKGNIIPVKKAMNKKVKAR